MEKMMVYTKDTYLSQLNKIIVPDCLLYSLHNLGSVSAPKPACLSSASSNLH